MNKYTLECIGTSVTGPEEDYLLTEDETIGISNLVSKVGVDKISWQTATAFETSSEEHFKKYREEYISEKRIPYPPIFKFKISVEAEKLSPEETERFWKNKQINDE